MERLSLRTAGSRAAIGHEVGHEREAEAAADFALMTNLPVTAAGFVYRDESKATGCSPDWLVGDNSAGEVKTGLLSTVIGHVRRGGVPDEHMPQIQFGLWVTGFTRWYFVAMHPDLPSHIVEVEPDERWQSAIR